MSWEVKGSTGTSTNFSGTAAGTSTEQTVKLSTGTTRITTEPELPRRNQLTSTSGSTSTFNITAPNDTLASLNLKRQRTITQSESVAPPTDDGDYIRPKHRRGLVLAGIVENLGA